MSSLARSRGFTFIELMAALAILGVLVLVAAPLGEVIAQRRKEHDLRVALIEIRQGIDDYKRASEQGRILLKVGDTGYPPNLDALTHGVPDVRSPTSQAIYFLRRVPADPFAADQSQPAATWGLRSFASPPDHPEPGADVYDVYTRSTATGLNGVPYRQW
jgi:general secretion pathway protein G